MIQSKSNVILREPYGIAWLDDRYFTTADEGNKLLLSVLLTFLSLQLAYIITQVLLMAGGFRAFTVLDSTTGLVVLSSDKRLDLPSVAEVRPILGKTVTKRARNLRTLYFPWRHAPACEYGEHATVVFVFDRTDFAGSNLDSRRWPCRCGRRL